MMASEREKLQRLFEELAEVPFDFQQQSNLLAHAMAPGNVLYTAKWNDMQTLARLLDLVVIPQPLVSLRNDVLCSTLYDISTHLMSPIAPELYGKGPSDDPSYSIHATLLGTDLPRRYGHLQAPGICFRTRSSRSHQTQQLQVSGRRLRKGYHRTSPFRSCRPARLHGPITG